MEAVHPQFSPVWRCAGGRSPNWKRKLPVAAWRPTQQRATRWRRCCHHLSLPPQNKETTQDCSKQKMVMGTHTSGSEQNYLMIAEVQLPLEDSELDARQYDDERNEVGRVRACQGCTRGHA
jgi:hypothetical protein